LSAIIGAGPNELIVEGKTFLEEFPEIKKVVKITNV
jgi:hypothetical protein